MVNCGIYVSFRHSHMGWPAIGPQICDPYFISQETLRTLGSETSTSVGSSEISSRRCALAKVAAPADRFCSLLQGVAGLKLDPVTKSGMKAKIDET